MKNTKKTCDHDYRVDGINLKDIITIKVPFRGRTLSFSKPSTAALFLDYSYVLWFTSQHTYVEHKFIKDENDFFISIDNRQDEFQLFHTLEQKMASIIFAYTAIEAFSNELIPDDFVFKKTRADAKCDESYSKEQIERFISLDVKLSEILPQIMALVSPKGSKIWESYLRLKQQRDSIVHCKSTRNSAGTNKMLEKILSENITNPCLEAKEIIGYFLGSLPNKQQPMWFKNFYKLEEETPKNFFEDADFRSK